MFDKDKWSVILAWLGVFIVFMLILLAVIGLSSFIDLFMIPSFFLVPSYFPSISLQQLPQSPLFPIIIAICAGLGGVLIILKRLHGIYSGAIKALLASLLVVLLTFLLVTFVIGGVLYSLFVNPYVSMTRTGFVRNSVDLSTGEILSLQNAADGVTQVLCIGVNQKCQPESGAPDVLNHGLRVRPGQVVTVTFNTPGGYSITSETTPGMNLSIDVTTPSTGGHGG